MELISWRADHNADEALNIDEVEDRVNADGMERLTNMANWTNLNSFFGRGGKMLYYHG
jgi:feruloyl esterase